MKWYGHVLRRDEEHVSKRVMAMEVPGERRRGRQKRRWLGSIRNDLSVREKVGKDAEEEKYVCMCAFVRACALLCVCACVCNCVCVHASMRACVRVLLYQMSKHSSILLLLNLCCKIHRLTLSPLLTNK